MQKVETESLKSTQDELMCSKALEDVLMPATATFLFLLLPCPREHTHAHTPFTHNTPELKIKIKDNN